LVEGFEMAVMAKQAMYQDPMVPEAKPAKPRKKARKTKSKKPKAKKAPTEFDFLKRKRE